MLSYPSHLLLVFDTRGNETRRRERRTDFKGRQMAFVTTSDRWRVNLLMPNDLKTEPSLA